LMPIHIRIRIGIKTDPHGDPTPSFILVRKSDFFYFCHSVANLQCFVLSFSSASSVNCAKIRLAYWNFPVWNRYGSGAEKLCGSDPMRIRPNPDPDPQHWLEQSGRTTHLKEKPPVLWKEHLFFFFLFVGTYYSTWRVVIENWLEALVTVNLFFSHLTLSRVPYHSLASNVKK